MTQSISVVYVPVPVELGITVHAYHMAIVYDKGDGTAPKVIEAKPLIEFEGAGTEAQRNEVPRELNELYNPAAAGPGADRNSPFGRLNAFETDRDSSFDRYDLKVVITGDNLGSKWDAIQGTIGFVNDGNFAYLPLIQNSNTFAAFALQRAGLQVPDTSFFVGGTDQTSNMYVPAMGKPLSIHQNPNASSLEDVSGTAVGELDGSITILALANDPNQAGVIKVSANINSKDQTTEVETASSDGTSTKTVFDTGAEAWSSETSAFDAYQRLQSQRVVLDGGGQQVKEYDPNNTHPYNELDIDEDAAGKITAAKPRIDGQPASNTDFSAVGHSRLDAWPRAGAQQPVCADRGQHGGRNDRDEVRPGAVGLVVGQCRTDQHFQHPFHRTQGFERRGGRRGGVVSCRRTWRAASSDRLQCGSVQFSGWRLCRQPGAADRA